MDLQGLLINILLILLFFLYMFDLNIQYLLALLFLTMLESSLSTIWEQLGRSKGRSVSFRPRNNGMVLKGVTQKN